MRGKIVNRSFESDTRIIDYVMDLRQIEEMTRYTRIFISILILVLMSNE